LAGKAKTADRNRTDRTDQTDRTDLAQRRIQGDLFGCYGDWLNHRDPAVVANAVICLIHQANYLLDLQISVLERAFGSEGG